MLIRYTCRCLYLPTRVAVDAADGGPNLKVVDEYDDGAAYAGGMTHVESADTDGDCQASTVTTCAWIFPSTAPPPNRRAIAASAMSVASVSCAAPRASMSLRSGVPWQ